MEKSYEMVYDEHLSGETDEYALPISILEQIYHDIKKVLHSPYVKLNDEERVKEARKLIKEFKECEYSCWFEEGTITYIVEELEKEIKEYEQNL